MTPKQEDQTGIIKPTTYLPLTAYAVVVVTHAVSDKLY